MGAGNKQDGGVSHQHGWTHAPTDRDKPHCGVMVLVLLSVAVAQYRHYRYNHSARVGPNDDLCGVWSLCVGPAAPVLITQQFSSGLTQGCIF
mgnify:CR=1 FL=1